MKSRKLICVSQRIYLISAAMHYLQQIFQLRSYEFKLNKHNSSQEHFYVMFHKKEDVE